MKLDFSTALSSFFEDYLSSERGVSPNTIRSYSGSFVLLLEYFFSKKNIPAEKIKLTDISRTNVVGFLEWLESDKKSTVSTRNQRLAAIHSFCKKMQYEDVQHLQQWQEVLSIKAKKSIRPTVNYLTMEGMKLLLAQIPQNTRKGRRDLTMLALLYETGARVQELADLRPIDLTLTTPSYVTLFGKGSKKRLVPIQQAVVHMLKDYLEENNLNEPRMNQRPLFQNNSGSQLTTAGIAYILKEYVAMARTASDGLIPDKLSPHCIRHSKAMHLLQSGVNLVYIRDILGHVSVQTTEIYARADSKLKREALEKAYEPVMPTAGSSLPSWQREPKLKEWLKNLGK